MKYIPEWEVEWKDIDGYEGIYQVSENGDVRSFRRQRIKRLSKRDSNGYKYVTLYKDGEMDQRSIHRLVAKAFIPNPYNMAEVNHINGDKSYNRVCNLEWCTRSENMARVVKDGAWKNNRGEKAYQAKVTKKEVIAIRNRYKEENVTQKELAKDFGIKQGHVCDIVNRRSWKHI